MSKTATVKSVQGTGTHTDQYGLKYDWEIEMDNGDVGVYSSNTETQDYFVAGREVEYMYIPHGKYPKIKRPAMRTAPTQQRTQSGDKVQLYIIRQSSLKAAIDYHNITMDKKPSREDIADTAEFFTNYVLNGMGGEEKPQSDSPPPHTEEDLF